MGQHGRAGGRYVTPIDSNGVTQEGTAQEGPGRGIFTLQAGTTYYYILGNASASIVSVQLTGYDAALVLTSAEIQDCNHMEQDVLDKSSTTGEWSTEQPGTAYVATDGTGWSAANGVGAAAGSGAGGLMWHFGENAAARIRLKVVVGAAGGRVRLACHGKD